MPFTGKKKFNCPAGVDPDELREACDDQLQGCLHITWSVSSSRDGGLTSVTVEWAQADEEQLLTAAIDSGLNEVPEAWLTPEGIDRTIDTMVGYLFVAR